MSLNYFCPVLLQYLTVLSLSGSAKTAAPVEAKVNSAPLLVLQSAETVPSVQ